MHRRVGVLVVAGVLAAPLAVVATAFACANLATVKLDHAGATPGAQVSLVGRNFNSSPAASVVSVRWNSRSGKVLYEGRPVDGKLRGTFTVPKARPGYYVVVATQTGPNGAIAAGTPGRAPLKIRASRRSSEIVGAPAGGPAAAPPLAPIGLGLLALGLLGGLTTIATRGRRSRVTAAPVA